MKTGADGKETGGRTAAQQFADMMTARNRKEPEMGSDKAFPSDHTPTPKLMHSDACNANMTRNHADCTCGALSARECAAISSIDAEAKGIDSAAKIEIEAGRCIRGAAHRFDKVFRDVVVNGKQRGTHVVCSVCGEPSGIAHATTETIMTAMSAEHKAAYLAFKAAANTLKTAEAQYKAAQQAYAKAVAELSRAVTEEPAPSEAG